MKAYWLLILTVLTLACENSADEQKKRIRQAADYINGKEVTITEVFPGGNWERAKDFLNLPTSFVDATNIFLIDPEDHNISLLYIVSDCEYEEEGVTSIQESVPLYDPIHFGQIVEMEDSEHTFGDREYYYLQVKFDQEFFIFQDWEYCDASPVEQVEDNNAAVVRQIIITFETPEFREEYKSNLQILADFDY